MFAAGSILVAIPIVILFITMQRYYVEGVTAGAVKG
jgi:arabinogalactan oligomer/maltooligosaccharide transport system permease protein